MYDLIIIGSGPAGLSAAVYGKRAGLNLLVLEKAPMSGGQVLNTYEVDNYLGMPGINGFDMGMQFREHADKLGAEFIDAEVLSLEVAAAGAEVVAAGTEAAAAGAEVVAAGAEVAAAGAEVVAAGTEVAAVGAEVVAAETGIEAEVVVADADVEVDSAEVPAPVKVNTTEGEFEAKTVILAVGADHAHLNVPGEEEFSGRGVSYCATCDGAFYRGKTVAVVGGGDVALEDAIYLSRFCEKVYLIHRRDELRGARILQEELMSKENVEILYSHTVTWIQGTEQVTGVMLNDVKKKEEKLLALDGVFIAVGIMPNTELVKDIVNCDEGGYVIAGEDCVTNVPGVFVAGDARKKPLRQIITAVADGANAVTSIGAYLAHMGR